MQAPGEAAQGADVVRMLGQGRLEFPGRALTVAVLTSLVAGMMGHVPRSDAGEGPVVSLQATKTTASHLSERVNRHPRAASMRGHVQELAVERRPRRSRIGWP